MLVGPGRTGATNRSFEERTGMDDRGVRMQLREYSPAITTKRWPLLSAVSINRVREAKPTNGSQNVTHKQQVQWTNRAACFIAGLFGFCFFELIELIVGAQ